MGKYLEGKRGCASRNSRGTYTVYTWAGWTYRGVSKRDVMSLIGGKV